MILYKNKSFFHILLLAGLLISHIAFKLQNNYLLLIGFIPILIYCAFCNDKEKIFYTFCFYLASNRVMTLVNVSILILIIVCFFVCKLLYGKLLLNKGFVYLSILLIIYAMQYIFRSEGKVFLDTIKIILTLFFFIEISKTSNIEIYEKGIRYIAFGIVCTTIISWLFNLSDLTTDIRFGLTDSGENVLGIICLITGVHLFIMKLRNTKSVNFALIMCLFFIGFLTGSRTFIIGLVLGMIFIVITVFFSKGKVNKMRMLVLLVFMLILLLFLLYFSDGFATKFEYFLSRIINPKNNDITNGRDDLWQLTIQNLLNNKFFLWFGAGSNINLGVDMVAHNMILEELTVYGIIGTVLYTILYIYSYFIIRIKCFMNFQISIIGMIPMILIFVTGMFSHTLLGIPQSTLLFLSIFPIFMNSRKLPRRF